MCKETDENSEPDKQSKSKAHKTKSKIDKNVEKIESNPEEHSKPAKLSNPDETENGNSNKKSNEADNEKNHVENSHSSTYSEEEEEEEYSSQRVSKSKKHSKSHLPSPAVTNITAREANDEDDIDYTPIPSSYAGSYSSSFNDPNYSGSYTQDY